MMDLKARAEAAGIIPSPHGNLLCDATLCENRKWAEWQRTGGYGAAWLCTPCLTALLDEQEARATKRDADDAADVVWLNRDQSPSLGVGVAASGPIPKHVTGASGEVYALICAECETTDKPLGKFNAGILCEACYDTHLGGKHWGAGNYVVERDTEASAPPEPEAAPSPLNDPRWDISPEDMAAVTKNQPCTGCNCGRPNCTGTPNDGHDGRCVLIPLPRTCTQCGAEEGYVRFAYSTGVCFDCKDDFVLLGPGMRDRKQPDEKLPGEEDARWEPPPFACGLRGWRMMP